MADSDQMQILIIDDEPFLLKLMRGMLRRLGYADVVCYEQGEAALAALAAGEVAPQAILLDINMPGIDGVAFVRQLAERGFSGGLVLVSGEDEAMVRATSMLASVRGLNVAGALRKPPQPELLSPLLEQCRDLAARTRRDGPAGESPRYSPTRVAAAIAQGELRNFYQPKVLTSSGEVVGVETLVRWQHPEDGLVAPAFFVGIAEEHGLINALTHCVYGEAARQTRAWQLAGLSLKVAVNLSMENLAEVNSADIIINEALAAGADPAMLVLEVTESRLMLDLATVLDVLARLHLKRFRLSIDDFGTGHSSLVVLRDLLFDELKIDAGFVRNAWRNERLASFFRASLDLARHLKMEAVAEGVETREDWDFVRASGCHVAQGYFVARPMPAEAIPGWIADWQARLLNERLLD